MDNTCQNDMKIFLHRSKLSLYAILFVFLFSCRASSQRQTYSALIGMWSEPEFKELSIGMNIGKTYEYPNLAVFSKGDFGILKAITDNTRISSFKRGSVLLKNFSKEFKLEGITCLDLVMIIIREVDSTNIVEIIDLRRIPAGKVLLHFKIKEYHENNEHL